MLKTKNKAKLLISKDLVNKVTYLHRKIKAVEWSGILLYSVEKGSIEHPDSLVLKAQNFHLMDIGTSTYTEYDFGPEIMDMYDEYPDADPFKAEEEKRAPWKIGHIHTHHDMNAYFSATDEKELEDNAPNHNYYLSLIVNFEGTFVASIAIASDVEVIEKYSYKNAKGKRKSMKMTSTKKETIVIECELEFEGQDKMDERLKLIEEEARVARLAAKPSYMGGTHYGREYPDNWDTDTSPYAALLGSNQKKGTNSKVGTKKATDISPHQMSLDTGASISRVLLMKFLTSLILEEADSSLTLYQAITKTDMYADVVYQEWSEDVDQKMQYYYWQHFPETAVEFDEAAIDCISILKVYQSSRTAIDLVSIFQSHIAIDA